MDKLDKLIAQQANPFSIRNISRKIAKFCVCVEMFSRNAMLELHPILLWNLLHIVYTWTNAKFGEHTPGLARAMCTCQTLPKRIRAGQSETQTFPGFKTKNYS